MANNLTPVIYDTTSKTHIPAPLGEHINPAYIAIDPNTSNLLKNNPSLGMGVFGVDLVSTTAGNMLSTGADGKLYVNASTTGNLSKQPLNFLRYGSDMGLYCDANDVLSNGATNLLREDPTDHKVILTAADLTAAGLGPDPAIAADIASLKSDMATAKTDIASSKTAIATNTGDIAVLKSAVSTLQTDMTVAKSDISVSKTDISTLKTDVAALKAAATPTTIVSTNYGNILRAGTDGGAYLDTSTVVSAVTAAGITGNASALVNPSDPFLTATSSNTIASNASIRYNSTTGRLDLLGASGAPVASANIPSALSVLQRVYDETNPAGYPAGTYIHFEFRMTDGSISDVLVDAKEFGTLYSAGTGINISSTGVISVDGSALSGSMLSSDLGNELALGSDGKLFYQTVSDYGTL